MILNYFDVMDPVADIPEDAPVNLIGACTYYVPNCIYVYQKEANVIADAGKEGGHLLFQNAQVHEIHQMLESAFSFFDEYYSRIHNAAKSLDYIQFIDLSWAFFRNPIVLLDASNAVITMSHQYNIDEVNEDWKYLYLHRHSSYAVQKYLLLIGKQYNYFNNKKPTIYHLDSPLINCNELSVAIYNNNVQYGRLNIIEKSKKINPGDLYITNSLLDDLCYILTHTKSTNNHTTHFVSVFNKLLHNDHISEEDFEYWKATSGWKRDKKYRLIVCKDLTPTQSPDKYRNLECLIRSQFGDNGGVAFTGNHLAFMQNDKFEQDIQSKWDDIIDFLEDFNLEAGISLIIQDIHFIHCYYDQALFALRQGRKEDPQNKIHPFFPYAIDYLLSGESLYKKRCACQSDIKKLWENDTLDGGEKIITLNAYLANERSLTKTAEQLYIHKNTLIYRINKIKDIIICDLNDSYTREFMKISIRVCHIFEAEYSGLLRSTCPDFDSHHPGE